MVPATLAALTRTWVVLRHGVWLTMAAVMVPVLLAAEVGTHDAGLVLAGVVVAVALTLLCRFGGVGSWLLVGTCGAGAAGQAPTLSGQIPDPRHHPVRPRAPGLV